MDKSFTAHEAGHKFLARLGKKRLRARRENSN